MPLLMQNIISKIPREAILDELTPEKYVRNSNNGANKIYIITSHNSPNVMTELGRLRELTFRHAGGGTGKAIDIDEFDVCEHPYQQLLVWNPEESSVSGRSLRRLA